MRRALFSWRDFGKGAFSDTENGSENLYFPAPAACDALNFAILLLTFAQNRLNKIREGFWDVMKKIENKLVGIDQGELVLFSDYESGGDMWTGHGDRIRRHSVRFSERFTKPPAVHVALSMWDIDSSTNARMEISSENVTPTGFDCVFRTWADTHVARARMRWMAIGELVHEDSWELY